MKIFKLFSSIRLDGRKDRQSVKSDWSICIQSLKSASHPLASVIIKDTKRTYPRLQTQQNNTSGEVSYCFINKSA